jgi:hypothetical protein
MEYWGKAYQFQGILFIPTLQHSNPQNSKKFRMVELIPYKSLSGNPLKAFSYHSE